MNEIATQDQTCCLCGDRLRGRIDKKFCDDACRNKYHYMLKRKEMKKIRRINYILRKNRRIIETLIQEEITLVHRDELIRQGFYFDFHTHTHTTPNGYTYQCWYDVGCRKEKTRFYRLLKIELE